MTAFRAYLPYKAYRFSGEDTVEFLQGQLTQDISLITNETCHYGAYCDAKGRMLANFLIHKDDDDYILRLHEALAENVIKRLQMFILRAKVTVTPLELQFLGLNKAAAEMLCKEAGIELPNSFACMHTANFSLSTLPHDYFELSLQYDSETPKWPTDIAENIDEIEQLRLSGGHFNVLPDTNEKLLPQQTPLEAWGAINYQKGCYVGQEIIARNKYRGKVKKGMGYAMIETPIELTLPATVSREGKAVGQIVDYHRSSKQTFCLAIISLDSLEKSVAVSEQPTLFSPIHSS